MGPHTVAARLHATCDLEISPSKARNDQLDECTGPINPNLITVDVMDDSSNDVEEDAKNRKQNTNDEAQSNVKAVGVKRRIEQDGDSEDKNDIQLKRAKCSTDK